MKKPILAALTVIGLPFLAAPSFAAPSCASDGAAAPMWQVAKTFEDGGGQIRELKVSDGCYEIYGTEGDKKVEIYFDPKTGAELDRVEK